MIPSTTKKVTPHVKCFRKTVFRMSQNYKTAATRVFSPSYETALWWFSRDGVAAHAVISMTTHANPRL